MVSYPKFFPLACPDSITHRPKVRNTVPHAEGGYPGSQGKRDANDCIALCTAPGLGLSGQCVSWEPSGGERIHRVPFMNAIKKRVLKPRDQCGDHEERRKKEKKERRNHENNAALCPSDTQPWFL